MPEPIRSIYRYELKITDYQVISTTTPPLAVAPGRNHNGIDLWAFNIENVKTVPRSIYILGTGNPISVFLDLNRYIGTVVMPNGLVWHVFEGSVKPDA